MEHSATKPLLEDENSSCPPGNEIKDALGYIQDLLKNKIIKPGDKVKLRRSRARDEPKQNENDFGFDIPNPLSDNTDGVYRDDEKIYIEVNGKKPKKTTGPLSIKRLKELGLDHSYSFEVPHGKWQDFNSITLTRHTGTGTDLGSGGFASVKSGDNFIITNPFNNPKINDPEQMAIRVTDDQKSPLSDDAEHVCNEMYGTFSFFISAIRQGRKAPKASDDPEVFIKRREVMPRYKKSLFSYLKESNKDGTSNLEDKNVINIYKGLLEQVNRLQTISHPENGCCSFSNMFKAIGGKQPEGYAYFDIKPENIMLKNISNNISPEDVVLIDLDGVKRNYKDNKFTKGVAQTHTLAYAPIKTDKTLKIIGFLYGEITANQATNLICARLLHDMCPNEKLTPSNNLLRWLLLKVKKTKNDVYKLNQTLCATNVTNNVNQIKNIPSIEQQLEIFEKYEYLFGEDSSINPELDIFFKKGIVKKYNARDASEVISSLDEKIEELSAENNAGAGNNHNNGM